MSLCISPIDDDASLAILGAVRVSPWIFLLSNMPNVVTLIATVYVGV